MPIATTRFDYLANSITAIGSQTPLVNLEPWVRGYGSNPMIQWFTKTASAAAKIWATNDIYADTRSVGMLTGSHWFDVTTFFVGSGLVVGSNGMASWNQSVYPGAFMASVESCVAGDSFTILLGR